MTKIGRLTIISSCIYLFAICPGCGYRVTSVLTSNTVYPPKPSTYVMEVFYEIPAKPYVVVGNIFAAPRNPGDVSTWKADKVLKLLKEKAMKIGADALIVKDISMAPSGTVGQGGFSGSGQAIHWK